MGTRCCCSRDDAVPQRSARINTDDKSRLGFDLYDVNEHKLGKFIEEKVNVRTATRLIQQLKMRKKNQNNHHHTDEDDNVIKAQHCIYVLLFTCVLYLKYRESSERRPEVHIDRKKLKKSLMPSYNWMLEYKLDANGTLKASQYKILGKWLQEYYVEKTTNGHSLSD